MAVILEGFGIMTGSVFCLIVVGIILDLVLSSFRGGGLR